MTKHRYPQCAHIRHLPLQAFEVLDKQIMRKDYGEPNRLVDHFRIPPFYNALEGGVGAIESYYNQLGHTTTNWVILQLTILQASELGHTTTGSLLKFANFMRSLQISQACGVGSLSSQKRPSCTMIQVTCQSIISASGRIGDNDKDNHNDNTKAKDKDDDDNDNDDDDVSVDDDDFKEML